MKYDYEALSRDAFLENGSWDGDHPKKLTNLILKLEKDINLLSYTTSLLFEPWYGAGNNQMHWCVGLRHLLGQRSSLS